MESNKNIKIVKLSDNKVLSFIIFIILKIASYSFFTPFIFLLGVNLILLLLFIQTSGVIDLENLFHSLQLFLYNIFGEQVYQWGNNGTTHYDENDLKNFIWKILFWIGIIFGIIDFIYHKIFRTNIKINILKLIKYIIIISYFIYISFFYFIEDILSTIGVMIGLIPILLYVYFSSFISIKFNKWSQLIFNETFINNLTIKNTND